MKNLLIGLLVLGSISASADSNCVRQVREYLASEDGKQMLSDKLNAWEASVSVALAKEGLELTSFQLTHSEKLMPKAQVLADSLGLQGYNWERVEIRARRTDNQKKTFKAKGADVFIFPYGEKVINNFGETLSRTCKVEIKFYKSHITTGWSLNRPIQITLPAPDDIDIELEDGMKL